MTRALICGWPSIPGGEATAGDVMTMACVREMLVAEGVQAEVALNDGFPDGVDLGAAEAEDYDHLVFVCGPLHDERVATILDRFGDARRTAVNVSVVDPELADRFDVVIARDGDGQTRPDLSFVCPPALVPVIGVVRAHPQPEYAAADHDHCHDVVRLALASRPCATVDFDTRVHPAADPLAAHARSSEAVASLAARMDVVVSTRLHGAVMSLAQGTPAVAIDPVRGGAKVLAQMQAIGWPSVFTADALSSEQLAQSIEWCLTEDARDRAATTAGAAAALGEVRSRLVAAVTASPP